MLQQSYGKYIRDDGDALLRAYVAAAEAEQAKQEVGEDETDLFFY